MKRLLMVFAVLFTMSLVFMGSTYQNSYAAGETVTTDILDEEILTEFDLQLEQIKAIIMAVIASVVGTGLMGLIIKVALDKLTKELIGKVTKAEENNKISQSQAAAVIAGVELFKGEVFVQIGNLEKTVQTFVQAQSSTNKSVDELLAEFKAREETLKDLLEQVTTIE